MAKRTLTSAESLHILQVERPRIPKGSSQKDVDRIVNWWKKKVLTPHFRKLAKLSHPDRNKDPEASDDFQKIREAYLDLKNHYQIRVKKKPPKPKQPTNCASCASERTPKTANYCFNCGFDYKETDVLVIKLMRAGLSRDTVEILKLDGTIDEMREIPSTSQELDIRIKVLRRNQELGLLIGNKGLW